jgi:antitoxin component YwqK of YwqJK toxin-antitoxin module
LGQEEKIINANDITEINGTFYFKLDMTLDTDKSNMTLVTGKVNEFYETGQLKEEVTFKEGKRDGIWKLWDENGNLMAEGIYKDGKDLNTVFKSWYENGQLSKQATLKDGKAEGNFKEWYKNGQLKQEGTFKNDKQVGLSKEYYEKGQLKIEKTWKDGELDGLSKEWYENGHLKYEFPYKDGKLDGLRKEWYENGQLRSETDYKNGKIEGLMKGWYQNGQLNFEATFLDGKQDGLSRIWFEDGRIKSESTYKDGVVVGDLKNWSENGQLKDETIHKEALPQTTTCYKEDEIPSQVNTFNYSGHQYKYIKKHVSWDVAKQLAEKEGGYLAVFETLEEMNYVTAACKKKSTYWVGLSDSRNESNWIWINGTALNKNMEGYLEKGNDLNNRDYGHIMSNGGLMSRHISGGLPNGWHGQMCVSGYLIEFDSNN